MIDFVLKIQNRIWNIGFIFKENFCLKASEVDQGLECEMHLTKYKEMIGCTMD
jgi:hypothetical protein